MIYNYTRCESVIAKIMADLDSKEARQRTSDIKEWIFEAIDKIGAPMQYIKKESGVDEQPIPKIEDNQVPLPRDLAVLDGVAYSENEKGPWVPMSPRTNMLKEDNSTKYGDMYSVYKYETGPEYFIKPGWLVTNKNKGYIKFIYKAIAVDERGYPMIPDLSSYREAIYWYVTMKLCFPKFMSGTLGGRGVSTAQNVYFYTQQQWNFYRNQAYAEAMMPTATDVENIKNDWNKLVPEWDSNYSFYKDINKQQDIYTDYYYGR